MLFPDDPWERARHRELIVAADRILAVVATMIYRDASASCLERSRLEMVQKLGVLEGEAPSGPYFAGERFLLIDAVFATVFRYIPPLESLLQKPILTKSVRLAAWSERLRARPSASQAVPPEYERRLFAFIAQRESALGELARRVLEPTPRKPRG